MGQKEKLVVRFLSQPTDFTWDEMIRLLVGLGYVLEQKGKTSGSRVIFKRNGTKPIMLHRPHPGNVVKMYALKQVLEYLKSENLI